MNEHQDGAALRRVLIGGIIVGLLVLLTTPFWLFGSDDDPAKPTPSGQPPTQSKSMCGLPDGDQSIPTEGPKAKWVLVGRTAIPTNKQIGPGDIRDGVPECFAHSPIGAVFAAMGVSAADRSEDASTRAYRSRFAHPMDYDPGSPDGVVFQIAGFRVDHYDRKHATITLPLRATTGPKAGGLAAATVDLVWLRGDWRVERTNLASIASVAGFVEWAGA